MNPDNHIRNFVGGSDGIVRWFEVRLQGGTTWIAVNPQQIVWAREGSWPGGTYLRFAGAEQDIEVVAPYGQVRAAMAGMSALSSWRPLLVSMGGAV